MCKIFVRETKSNLGALPSLHKATYVIPHTVVSELVVGKFLGKGDVVFAHMGQWRSTLGCWLLQGVLCGSGSLHWCSPVPSQSQASPLRTNEVSSSYHISVATFLYLGLDKVKRTVPHSDQTKKKIALMRGQWPYPPPKHTCTR